MANQLVKGQVVKVATTADECIRVTIDVETGSIPEDLNILTWKNGMVFILAGPVAQENEAVKADIVPKIVPLTQESTE